MYACRAYGIPYKRCKRRPSSARTPLCHTEDLQFYSVKKFEAQRTGIFLPDTELCQSPAENRLFYFDSYVYTTSGPSDHTITGTKMDQTMCHGYSGT